jgi:hypothetical protein
MTQLLTFHQAGLAELLELPTNSIYVKVDALG